jgi:ParB family chromosome partitioning protein
MMNDSVKSTARGQSRATGGDQQTSEGTPVARSQSRAGTGRPLNLKLDLIAEDPAQPRAEDNPGFSPASIAELASTIQLRGVKSPVSVRKNPSAPGRYIINHGARRYRASKVAGKADIPAFIDDDYSQVDQVIENLQRNELTAREIANWIGREMAAGKKKGHIAKSLGKSAAFVSQHVTLLDLPEPIAHAFNTGRANDVTVVNELVTAFKKKPREVTEWLEAEQLELTRGAVKQFREFLEQALFTIEDAAPDENADADADTDAVASSKSDTRTREIADQSTKALPRSLKSAGNQSSVVSTVVKVVHNNRPAQLNLTRRPPGEGTAWVRYDDDGRERKARLEEVRLVALVVS